MENKGNSTIKLVLIILTAGLVWILLKKKNPNNTNTQPPSGDSSVSNNLVPREAIMPPSASVIQSGKVNTPEMPTGASVIGGSGDTPILNQSGKVLTIETLVNT